eukprot:6402898-Amphidinium_carterae.1
MMWLAHDCDRHNQQRLHQDMNAWAKVGVALSASMVDLTEDGLVESLCKSARDTHIERALDATDALLESNDYAECTSLSCPLSSPKPLTFTEQ